MFQYSMCGCAEREKEIMLPYIIKGILTRKNMEIVIFMLLLAIFVCLVSVLVVSFSSFSVVDCKVGLGDKSILSINSNV